MTTPLLHPGKPNRSTYVITCALCIIYLSCLWAPSFRIDDGIGYLIVTFLLVFGIQRWRQGQLSIRTLDVTERLFVLYLALVVIGLFFNSSDILSGVRHSLYAFSFFLLLTRADNQIFIRNTTALVAGGGSLLALAFSLMEWSWQSINAGKMVRYGFHDFSENPNLTAFLIMAGILAISTLMYRQRKQVIWIVIPVVSLFLSLFIFQTRSLFLGVPILFLLLGLKKVHSRKIALVAVTAAAIFLPILISTGVLQFFLEKGFNDRLSIWRDSSQQAMECGLLFGCGNDDPTTYGTGKHPHPHSGYLGILVYEGLPALIFFLGFLSAFSFQLIRQKTLPVWGASVVMVLAATLVTAPKLLMSFSAIWAYTWLPLALTWSEIRKPPVPETSEATTP